MTFPVEYSSLSTNALLELLVQHYAISKETSITFLKRGFNDTYLIKSGIDKFILRVYKHNWRSLASIETELRMLSYLRENNISVSYVIPDKNKKSIQSIDAPEGIRYVVLFSYAEGAQVRKLSVEQANLLGVEIGKMHLLTQNKSFGATAQNYDIDNQFEITLATLKPILINYMDEYEYLVRLKNEFECIFNSVSKKQITSGICHGDLQAENFYFNNNEQLTFFDFDFFGAGFLVYDIGVFVWYDHKNKPKNIIHSFLNGYQSQRKLTEIELKLIPYFSTLRALFQMTLYCKISDGKQLPIWPSHEVANFVKKIERWQGEFFLNNPHTLPF